MANKTQVVEALSERLGDRRQAAEAVDTLFDFIIRSVQSGERVTVTGFGTFEPRARAARTARNPRTGATVTVPEATVPAFRAGTLFRDVVAGTRELPATRTTTAAARPAATTRRAPAPKPAAAVEKPAVEKPAVEKSAAEKVAAPAATPVKAIKKANKAPAPAKAAKAPKAPKAPKKADAMTAPKKGDKKSKKGKKASGKKK